MYYKTPDDHSPNTANGVYQTYFPTVFLGTAFTLDLLIVYTAERDSAPEIQGHDIVAYNQ